MRKRFLKIAALSVPLAIASAQAPPPSGAVIRSNTRLVLLDVLANTDKGPVRGLTKDDFLLEDKGKKQAIVVFEATEPGKGGAGTALPAGIASNRLNALGDNPTNATVILFDRINSPSAIDQAYVRGQVLRVLAGLKDGDHVGFYSLGFGLQVVRDFDEDPAPLARVAKALQSSSTAPATFSAEDRILFKNLAEGLSPMQQPSNQARVNITYPAFKSIARHLSGIAGRKNLVWVAAVFPLTYGNAAERRKNDQAEVDAFRNNLTEANISLYPVDPGGTGASFNTSDAAPVANEGSLMPGRSGSTAISTNTTTSLTGNQSMQLFAEATGGKSYRNANDIEPALREVIALSGYSYTLGFYPDEKLLDNKTHDLKVTLVKKPATEKAKLAHRKQYFAWGPKSTAEGQMKPTIGDLIDDPLQARAIGLMAVVNPDPAKPTSHVLDVRVTARDLQFVPAGDQFTASFEIAIGLENPNGKVEKMRSVKAFTPTLAADVMQKVLENGVDTREIVDAGASGVFRIAILDKNSGLAGSLRVPFGGTAK